MTPASSRLSPGFHRTCRPPRDTREVALTAVAGRERVPQGRSETVKDPGNNTGRATCAGDPGSTSRSLLEGVKARDPGSWRRLSYLYGPLVYGWCRRRGLRAPEAEDQVQEVFLTVLTKVGAFRRERPGDTFRGWLRTITHHKVGNWLRRQKAHGQAFAGGEALPCL